MTSSGIETPKRIVAETSRLYSTILSHPPSERQLIRPNFNLIQTIVKSLITETRILRSVFNPNDFDNVKRPVDKRTRIDFVQRLIDFAANHKQPVVGCVAAKIVAGVDPIKGNELLQALARIAHIKLSGQDAQMNRPRTFTKQPQQSKQPKPIIYPTARSDISASSAGSQRTTSESRPSSFRSIESVQPIKTSKIVVASLLNDKNTKESSTSISRESDSKYLNVTSAETITPQLAQKKSTVVNISNENDINKNLQQLRLNLKILRNTLIDVGQMEISLRSKLNNLNEHL